jgi:hypothetical protein
MIFIGALGLYFFHKNEYNVWFLYLYSMFCALVLYATSKLLTEKAKRVFKSRKVSSDAKISAINQKYFS